MKDIPWRNLAVPPINSCLTQLGTCSAEERILKELQPLPYDYKSEIKIVMECWKSKQITKESLYRLLDAIENTAYALDPEAEPDGDITYCVASAVAEIEEYE